MELLHQIAADIAQLCAVSSSGAAAITSASHSGPVTSENSLLLEQLVELGAVPTLLRLQSLSYPGPVRESARSTLRALLCHQGDAVRIIAKGVNIPQPVGTSPAEWVAWQQELQQDLPLW